MSHTAPPADELACPQCGAHYSGEARFCPLDGAELTPHDPLVGQLLLGQIELQEVCGDGSMGTVYRAWQRTMERRVAVKILRRKLLRDAMVVKRFEREARAAASLSHPNIITVYLVGETDGGLPFMVMEYVDGQSLEQALEEGPLPPARVIHIARQITSALSDAHAQAIVHRDLKPANILLSNKRGAPDFVKVLDFGIAKILRDGDESQLTKTGAIFGTPYYLSPEQAAGEDVDHRCDLYSLGVLLFRMLTGRLPFESKAAVEVLVQHIKEPPPRPRDLRPSIPATVESLVLKALAKGLDERWQSADEMGKALGEIAERLYGGGSTLIGVTDTDVSNPEIRAPMSPVGPLTVPGRSAPSGPVATVRPTKPRPMPATRPSAAEQPATRDPQATASMARRLGGGLGATRWLVPALASIAIGAGAGALVHSYEQKERNTAADAAAAGAAGGSPSPAPDAAAVAPEDTSLADATAPKATRAKAPPTKRVPRAKRAKPVKRVPRAKRASRPKATRPKARPAPRRPAPAIEPKQKPKRIPHAVPPVGPDPDVTGSDHDPKDKDEIYDLVEGLTPGTSEQAQGVRSSQQTPTESTSWHS